MIATNCSPRQWLEITATVLVACAAVVVVVRTVVAPRTSVDERGSLGATPPVVLEIGRSPTVGKSTAPVAVVVFADFECPFCRELALDVLPSVKKRFVDVDKVQLVFKHFPLEEIHSEARRASELSACAGSDELFWRAHDWMFGLGERLDEVGVKTLAANVPVNVSAVEECLAQKARQLVDDDVSLGRRLGVRATPEVLIGAMKAGKVSVTKRLKGAQSPEVFRAVIETVLAGR